MKDSIGALADRARCGIRSGRGSRAVVRHPGIPHAAPAADALIIEHGKHCACGLAQPSVCLKRRSVCSRSKRRRNDCQQRSMSLPMAPVLDHQSQTGLFTPPLGSFSTTRRMTVPSMMGSGPS